MAIVSRFVLASAAGGGDDDGLFVFLPACSFPGNKHLHRNDGSLLRPPAARLPPRVLCACGLALSLSLLGFRYAYQPHAPVRDSTTGDGDLRGQHMWTSFWTCVGDHFFLNSKRTRQRVVYDLREKGGFSVFKVETTFMGRLVVKI